MLPVELKMKPLLLPLLLVLAMNPIACSRSTADPVDAPSPDAATQPEGVEVLNDAGQAIAVFAGGCFWCTEAVFERVKGVESVVSGYAGGNDDDANYQLVSAGATDHAEVIQITYDPQAVTYGELLKVFFTVAHDPTQLNRQGPDTGRQYRSAVFYLNDAQKQATAAYIQQLQDAGTFAEPIVTTLEPLTKFHPAEQYHQDYVRLNPAQPYVVYNALPKVKKLEKQLPEYVETGIE